MTPPAGGPDRGPEAEPERERRQPRSTTLSLAEVLDAFAGSATQHLTGGGTSEEELQRFEQRAGVRLPPSFRAFLARFGGGLYFHGHEIFGSNQVFIHDIELLPDLLSFQKWLASQGVAAPPGLLAFHRARGAIHALDLRPGSIDRVLRLDGSASFPDLASFLEIIVLPRRVQIDANGE